MKHSNALRATWKITLAVVTLSVATWVSADQLNEIKTRGELTCGVLGTDEPFSYIGDPSSRQIVGYDVDLCKAVADSLGVKLTLKQLAVAARIPELQQGRVDILAATLTRTKEREEQIDFSASTFVTGAKVMVKTSSGIDDLSQLADKRVLTVKGTTMEQNIRSTLPTAKVISFDTGPQALLALKQGKGVGFATDEATLVKHFAELGDDAKNYKIIAQNLSTENLALGIRKNEPAFKAQVDKVLLGLESSGDAQKIFMKWFGPETKMKYATRSFKFEQSAN